MSDEQRQRVSDERLVRLVADDNDEWFFHYQAANIKVLALDLRDAREELAAARKRIAEYETFCAAREEVERGEN